MEDYVEIGRSGLIAVKGGFYNPITKEYITAEEVSEYIYDEPNEVDLDSE